MRILRIPAVLLLLMSFAVGCADQSVPTGLSDSPTAATAAAPNLKAEHVYLVRDFEWTGAENVTCANDGAGEYLELNSARNVEGEEKESWSSE